MKRGKRILKVVWENVWVGSGMVFLLCIAQFFRLSQWNLESVKEIAGSMFAGGLVIVSAATLMLMVYSRYSVYEPLKIFMGYTRKKSFEDMQFAKLLSALFIALISAAAVAFGRWPSVKTEDLTMVFWGFVLMMLVQGAVELLTILYLKTRKQWIVLAAIVVACAGIGGFVGYNVMAIIDAEDIIEIQMSFLFLQENPHIAGGGEYVEKRKSTLEDQEKGVLYLYFTDWNSMDFWKPVYRSHESRDAAAWGSAFRHHAGCFWRHNHVRYRLWHRGILWI